MGRSKWVLVVALGALVAGCGDSGNEEDENPGPKSTFADGVIVIPEDPATPLLPGASGGKGDADGAPQEPGKPKDPSEPGLPEEPAEPEAPAPGAPLTAADCAALVTAEGRRIHVAPSGTAGADGSAENPIASIQAALNDAQPGDTVVLAPGRYTQDVRTVRNGTTAEPIALIGTPDAVVVGGGEDRVIEVNHDHHLLCGFTVDGLHGDAGSEDGFRDKLVYATGTAAGDGVTGLRLLAMDFRNAGGECVRLKYFATANEVAWSRFERCGVHDYVFAAGGKNGEAVYIGTAPEQLAEKNPTPEPDLSNDNHVHDNVFDTRGNECVDIKEAASGNVVERNRCTGQLDPESGGMDSRGSGNTFRRNEIQGNAGAGIRLGGDEADQGIDNVVEGNVIRDNARGGVKVMRSPQRKICGNTLENNTGGDAVGDYADDYAPGLPCDGA